MMLLYLKCIPLSCFSVTIIQAYIIHVLFKLMFSQLYEMCNAVAFILT